MASYVLQDGSTLFHRLFTKTSQASASDNKRQEIDELQPRIYQHHHSHQ